MPLQRENLQPDFGSPETELKEEKPNFTLLAYLEALHIARKLLSSYSSLGLTPPTIDELELEISGWDKNYIDNVLSLISEWQISSHLPQILNPTELSKTSVNRKTLGDTLFSTHLNNLLCGGIVSPSSKKIRQQRSSNAHLATIPGWRKRRKNLIKEIVGANPKLSIQKISRLVRERELVESVGVLQNELFPITASDRELFDELFLELEEKDPHLTAIIAAGSMSSGGRVVRQLLGYDISSQGYANVGCSFQDVDYIPIHSKKIGRTTRTMIFPESLKNLGLNGEFLRHDPYVLSKEKVVSSMELLFAKQVELAIESNISEEFILYDFLRPISPKEIEKIIHQTLLNCMQKLKQTDHKSWYLVLRQIFVKRLLYHRLKPKHFDTAESLGESSAIVTSVTESSSVRMMSPFLNFFEQL